VVTSVLIVGAYRGDVCAYHGLTCIWRSYNEAVKDRSHEHSGADSQEGGYSSPVQRSSLFTGLL
jgi:hypothetical protein